MTEQTDKAGHRERLRQRFLANPTALAPTQLLELLLAYAIPRQDVAPLAQTLIDHFGSIEQILAASYAELLAVPGIGSQTAIFIQVLAHLIGVVSPRLSSAPASGLQPALFEIGHSLSDEATETVNAEVTIEDESQQPTEAQIRTFANDEIANALTFIPQAAQFENLEAFKTYLSERLPYNSASTRQRRTNYIIERFFPEERLATPLTYYAAQCHSTRDLKPVLFYHLLKAEPLAAKVAEEFIWPALPIGRVEREAMREFILRYLPEVGPASQTKILRSLFRTYDLLAVGAAAESTLCFQVQRGTLEAFLYLLTAEFPQPGMYTFEALEETPLRRWLLWDREWMRRQLYNLRDFGLISKISEIDTIRQFTLQFNQTTALRHYFEHPQRDTLVLREDAVVP